MHFLDGFSSPSVPPTEKSRRWRWRILPVLKRWTKSKWSLYYDSENEHEKNDWRGFFWMENPNSSILVQSKIATHWNSLKTNIGDFYILNTTEITSTYVVLSHETEHSGIAFQLIVSQNGKNLKKRFFWGMETHRKGFAAPVKSKIEELFMTLHTMCNKVRFLGIFPTPPKHHSEIVASKFSHNFWLLFMDRWTVEEERWKKSFWKGGFVEEVLQKGFWGLKRVKEIDFPTRESKKTLSGVSSLLLHG